jgi:hypothetical protein
MRLDRFQNRIRAVDYKLARCNVISMHIAWLQARALREPVSALPIKDWCSSLVHLRCTREEIMHLWDSSLRSHSEVPPQTLNRIDRDIEKFFNKGKDCLDKKPKQMDASNCFPQGVLRNSTNNYWASPPRDKKTGKVVSSVTDWAENSHWVFSNTGENQPVNSRSKTEQTLLNSGPPNASEIVKLPERDICRRCSTTGKFSC